MQDGLFHENTALQIGFGLAILALVWLRDKIDRDKPTPPLRAFYLGLVAGGIVLLTIVAFRMLFG